MRATLRRNGRRMATFHLSMHLGGAEIAELLAYYAAVFGRRGDEPELGPGAAEKLIREQLIWKGTGAYEKVGGWTDGSEYDGSEIIEIGQWAVATVRRCWPELDDEALADWEYEYTGERQQ
jgi:hypothetical protein